MAATAQYAATPVSGLAQVSVANAGRDGSGTLVTIVTGGASGTRIDDITFKAAVTTTAGMVRLYLSTDNGTTNRLIREISVNAVTPSATVASWSSSLTDLGIVLQNVTTLLRASTEKAETINIAVTRAGNF